MFTVGTIVATLISFAATVGWQLYTDGTTVREMQSNMDVTKDIYKVANDIYSSMMKASNKLTAYANLRNSLNSFIRGISSSGAISRELRNVHDKEAKLQQTVAKLQNAYDATMQLGNAASSNPSLPTALKKQEELRTEQKKQLDQIKGGLRDELLSKSIETTNQGK